MIRKRHKRNSDIVRVTFALPEDDPRAKSSVVGDFNDWDPEADPLVRRNNGTCSAVLRLKEGQRYHFRYRTQDGVWFNAGDADAYELNEMGEENGVLLT
jgi:1,4-alpha-glucan branching enzyme